MKSGYVSRLKSGRLLRVTEKNITTSRRGRRANESVGTTPTTRGMAIDYNEVRKEEDSFPDASNLEPVHLYQKDDIGKSVSVILNQADENGLSIEKKE